MTECGNVTTFVRALGIDVGSSHVKAVVACLGDGGMRELAVAQRRTAGLDAQAIVAAALDAAGEVLRATGQPVAVVGVASMAETGALVDPSGRAGELLRWDHDADPQARLALAGDLDPAALHAATGAPLTAKLPLLTWASLVRRGLPAGSRWAFAADLVAAALTGRIAAGPLVTDHTLAGRSGAYLLPAPGEPLGWDWNTDLLAAVGVDAALLRELVLPEILLPGEAAGSVRSGLLAGATGVAVHIAGHDHAVAARLAGAHRPGQVVHSLGTTEAVLALADPGRPVDRARAGAEGISVVRAVDGVHEGVLAGSPAAGGLIAAWRERAAATGADADALLAALPSAPGEGIALPYPRGRQAPAPDRRARYELIGDAASGSAAELTAILRGLAAHGAWMRAEVSALTRVSGPQVAAVGTPVRGNDRLAGLMASLAGCPLPVVDLAAPVAVGAAALAAEREGLTGPSIPPHRLVDPRHDGMPDLADRFAAAVAAHSHISEGAR